MRDRCATEGDQIPPESEKSLEKSPELANGATEVVYQYLTFETDVDKFIPIPQADPGPRAFPTRPDLRQYTSPFLWPKRRKNVVLALCCAATLCSAYTAGSYFLPAAALEQKWSLGTVAFNTGVTTWGIGFGIAPMVLAPFSELNGRRPVFTASGIVVVAAMIGCATTDSFAGMLVARFFVGAGASTFATMVGGVLSDIYHAEDRNTPMALYSGSALMVSDPSKSSPELARLRPLLINTNRDRHKQGTGLGPMISGFLAQNLLWRWVFWFQVILDAVVVGSIILFFQETRGSVLLSRKAKTLNKFLDELERTGCAFNIAGISEPNQGSVLENRPGPELRRVRFRVAADEDRSSISKLIYLSLTTPFKLLLTEPVVFFFSLWAAFAWGVLYMSFDDIPLVFEARGFSIQEVGAVYTAIAIGSIVGAVLSIYQEKIAKGYWKKLTTTPEGRLYFACVESALLPLGIFWFGWTSFKSIPWIVPVLALGCAQIGIFSIYLAVFNYLAGKYISIRTGGIRTRC